MADAPFETMSNEDLAAEKAKWERCVEDAPGWSSAYFAAKCLKRVIAEGNSRGLDWANRFPIKIG